MHRDLDVVFGTDGQVVGVLFHPVEENANIRIVPGDRLIELHQQELAVDARVGLVDDMTGHYDAGIPFRGLLAPEDLPNSAEDAA